MSHTTTADRTNFATTKPRSGTTAFGLLGRDKHAVLGFLIARTTIGTLAAALVSPPAHAENWQFAYRGTSTYSGAVEIDAESVQTVGENIRFYVRYPSFEGQLRFEALAANCTERTLGSWPEMSLHSTYPDTRNGAILEMACRVSAGLQSPQTITPKPPATAAQVPAPIAPTEPKKKRDASGSGFFVGPRYVVTNFHVVDGCTDFRVRRDTTTYSAKLRGLASGQDLAMLEVDAFVSSVPPIRVGAALGEDVMIAGHPLSGLLSADLIVTSGQVNSLAGLANDPVLLQISAPVQAGNSGGPVIDRAGAIVGVVVSKVNVERLAKVTGDIAQNVNFAIKPEVLRMFLDANRVPYRSATLGKRLEGVEIAERARSFTVQVMCNN